MKKGGLLNQLFPNKKFDDLNPEEFRTYYRVWARKRREDPAVRERQRQSDARYLQRHREEINARKRKRLKEDPEFRERRNMLQRIWRKNNLQKMLKKEAEYSRRKQPKTSARNKRHAETLTDVYVKAQLRRDSRRYISLKEIPQDLIGLKRLELQIKRIIKQKRRRT